MHYLVHYLNDDKDKNTHRWRDFTVAYWPVNTITENYILLAVPHLLSVVEISQVANYSNK